MSVTYSVVTVFLSAAFAFAQTAADDPQQTITLNIPAGVPLRLYLTKRVPKKVGAPVQAKVLEPVYAFDHEVIPAGAEVTGSVTRLESVPKSERTRAVLGGDFTPLHQAEIEFTSVHLADGRQIAVKTQESLGLNSIVPLKPPKQKNPKPQSQPTGVIGTGKQKIEDQINSQIDRVKSIPDIVRAPDKKERLSDYLMAKLPYHPQYVRNGTRFDAELKEPLNFGSETVTRSSMSLVGTQPGPNSIVHARLLTALDSSTTSQGEPVEAVLSQPLFSSDHKLILPEGTRLSGTVVLAKKARSFHRVGQLRFNFQNVDLPPEVAQLKFPEPVKTPEPAVEYQKVLQFRSQAILKGAESDKAPVKVDSEGGVKAAESKTRFIQTAIAVMIAQKSGDIDGHRRDISLGKGPDSNVSGKTLGGGLGFGLLGSLVAQSSRYVGAALGYYGMGWAVYSTVIARGNEVQFDKNSVVDIGFNPRAATIASH